jgi:hypothetical protein
MSEEDHGFDVLAEWTIRRLRPLQELTEEDYSEKVKRWVLYSIGLEKIHQDIFLYLEKNFRSTTTDISQEFSISPNTASKYLDELHTVGLVDYIGREYTLTYNSLSRAIELMLIPRITDTLRTIARGASSSDSTPYSFTPKDYNFTADPRPYARPDPRPGRSRVRKTVKETGIHILNQKMVDMWYQQGKKVRATAMNDLTIDHDVNVEMLDAVLERLLVNNNLTIPKDIYERLAHKIRIHGSVNTV